MKKLFRSFYKKYHGKFKTDAESTSKARRIFALLVLIAISTTLFGVFLFTVTMVVLSIGLPDVRQFDKLAGTQSSVIYDREGGILYTLHGEENRKYVPLSEISPYLQKATVAIEDDQFFYHSGFDLPGIGAAILHETFGIGSKRGGSTITQQLAKNAFLTPKRTYSRKLKELILAIRLERAYDKNKILELYLNRIPYGSNAYGAEMAARLYFGKPARELTLSESVVLAALPQAPTYYSPYGPHLYSTLDTEIEALNEIIPGSYSIGLLSKTITLPNGSATAIPGRAQIVLRRMKELGVIEEKELETAESDLQKISFTKQRETIRAAHFVFEIRRQLEELLGKEVIAQGGLQVYTTLDPKLQAVAEESLLAQITKSRDLYNVSTGAAFAMDAKTGEILTMVGAADYFDKEAHGNVNHVFAKRQPGSSFKPFIYAKAFLNRYAPATVLYDTPTDFGAGYRPNNYDGTFIGPMTIRRALGQSRNIPAIKGYFLAGQQEEIIPFVEKLGITSLDRNASYGPSLALGTGEVTLYEMVKGFSVFANSGMKREPFAILKVTDHDGDILFDKGKETPIPDIEVLDPQVAYLISSILSDHSVNLGQRLNISGHTVAVKTGTSTKPGKSLPSNVWTIGYTPSIVAGVWAGNSDGKEMKPLADGYNIAAPVWNALLTAALKDIPDERFPVPSGITFATVSNFSGKLASDATPSNSKITDIFPSFSLPTEVDTTYRTMKVVKNDGLLPNEYTPEDQIEERVFANHQDPITTYPSWEAGIREWVKNTLTKDSSFPNFPPTEETKIFTAQTFENKPSVHIITPQAYAIFNDRDVNVEATVSAPNGVKRVAYFLGDRTAPNVTKFDAPYKAKLKFSKTAPSDTYTITVKVIDDLGYSAESKIDVRYEAPNVLDESNTTDTTGTSDNAIESQ